MVGGAGALPISLILRFERFRRSVISRYLLAIRLLLAFAASRSMAKYSNFMASGISASTAGLIWLPMRRPIAAVGRLSPRFIFDNILLVIVVASIRGEFGAGREEFI